MWGAIIGFFTGIWNAVETVAITVATVISTIWSIIRPILTPLWSGVQWVYGNVLKPIYQWAYEHLLKLKQLYDSYVKPVVDRIYDIIRTVRRIWESILQPIFDTISALQQFLVLTRLNQTVFGQWLDGELNKIYATFQDLDRRFLAPLNAILHVLNEIVLDIDGAFRYAIMIQTTGKHIASISRQAWNSSLNLIGSVRFHDGTLGRLKPEPFHTTFTALQTQLESGSGPLAVNVDGARTVFLAVTGGQLDAVDTHAASAFAVGSLAE
jgi:hypothetical protein